MCFTQTINGYPISAFEASKIAWDKTMTGYLQEDKGVYLSEFHNCNKTPDKNNLGRKDLGSLFQRTLWLHWF